MAEDDRANPFEDGKLAADYDGWYDTPLGRVIDRLQGALVDRLARPRPGERALDVGTGTGHYAVRLAARGLRVTGVDRSEAMLAVARAKSASVARRKGAPVDWRQADAEHLPFTDGAFDLVLSVTMLEFVRDPLRALAEMHRVTAPGGRLVVGALNAESAWGRFYLAQARQMDTPFRHAQFFTPAEFVAALGRLGQPRWSSSLFVPTSGRGLWAADAFEWLGQHLWRGRGALLVGRIDK
jgi:ubiquinone/menaquinone biosynthesis C-methylase UbiE